MFEIGDKVLYPMYGAGVIEGIEERKILGEKKKYFTLKMPFGNSSAMIPIDTCEEIGVRYIISGEEAKKVLAAFRADPVVNDDNWNKRHRENMQKMKTGDIYELIGVVKSLMLRERTKGLSTSERKMYVIARQIFIGELVLTEVASQVDVESILADTIEELV